MKKVVFITECGNRIEQSVIASATIKRLNKCFVGVGISLDGESFGIIKKVVLKES